MNAISTRLKRTCRCRKTTALISFGEVIDEHGNEVLAGRKGPPQEVFVSVVWSFSRRFVEAMFHAHLKGIPSSINDNDNVEDVKGNDFDAPAAGIVGKRNGFSAKTLRTEYGAMTLDVRRDRHGTSMLFSFPRTSASSARSTSRSLRCIPVA